KTDLRTLNYSPEINPLMDNSAVPVKRKRVRSGLLGKPLLDPETMTLQATAVIHQIESIMFFDIDTLQLRCKTWQQVD
ncbi:hypothetical protein O5962_28725, partial [Escherichia coli]|nr:hypothetical protein [Escherichia coli]